MGKKELILAAQEALRLWAENPRPSLGEPKFKLIKNRPILTDFPIRWEYGGSDGNRLIYFIYAQETLDYFAELELLNTANLDGHHFNFRHEGKSFKVKAQAQNEPVAFEEQDTELIIPQPQKADSPLFSIASFRR
jgi:hypothetical protein